MTTKKLVLVAMMAVTTMAKATSIQLPFLEYSRTPIAPIAHGEMASVRVLDNGEVYGYRSRGRGPIVSRKLGTIPAYEMNRLREVVKRAARAPELVAPLYFGPVCAAVPMQRDAYRAPQHNLTLEENTNPCGSTKYNDTRSSLEIVNLLNGYRDTLYGITR